MRHRKKSIILDRSSGPRRALIRHLVTGFANHGFITTTGARAAAIRPIIEKLISRLQKDTLANRRWAIRVVGSNLATQKMINISQKMAGRTSGFTRVVGLNQRVGDGACMVKLVLVK